MSRASSAAEESTFRGIPGPEIRRSGSFFSRQWNVETPLPSRPSTVLYVILGTLLLGLPGCRGFSPSGLTAPAEPMIEKQPVNFANRTFDPTAPPSDMPPLSEGENAECESNFTSNASVGSRTLRTDATHAIVTITQVKLALGLNVTIWAPSGVSQHVMEHEQGHRRIAEHYYETAEKVAARVATPYMGRKTEVTGSDLDAEANKFLKQIAAEVTGRYEKELDPDPAQLLYDNITDHSRNDVVATDAVARALKETTASAALP